MDVFPAIDTIPLPGPVWLFKLLHVLLLSLHFVCVQMLLGGLLVAIVWSLRAKSDADSLLAEGARQITRVLPLAMTYVINLGVPPLLFAQVLFGHALYTATILIGAWWISLIFLLIGVYYLLYVGSGRVSDGRTFWPALAASLVLALTVAFIFSTTMTFMLRPEQWAEMYRATAHGTALPPLDPTKLPRWTFMLAGGLTIGGVFVVALGSMRRQSPELRALMFREGGLCTVLGVLLQWPLATMIVDRQPRVVYDLLRGSAVYHGAQLLWMLLAVALLVTAGWLASKAGQLAQNTALAPRLGWASSLLGVLLTVAVATYRDGIRDLTLVAKGFDVWSTPVTVNYGVLSTFLLVTVVTLAIVGVLIGVVVRANRPAEEAVTQ